MTFFEKAMGTFILLLLPILQGTLGAVEDTAIDSVVKGEVTTDQLIEDGRLPVPLIEQIEPRIEVLDGTPMESAAGAINNASEEWDVPVNLLIGIANAESSLGTNYYLEKDKNCHNAWGLKPSKGRRSDGSYLRCFDDWNEGANHIAMVLRKYYINEGRDTPEKISPKWVGKYSQSWVNHVNKYYGQ